MQSTAATTQRILERFWGLPRAPWSSVWRQLVWAVATVPGLTMAMYAVHLTRPGRGQAASPGVQVTAASTLIVAVVEGLCTFAFYWWTQHLLLSGRVSWRRLLPGSAVIGLGVALTVPISALLVPDELVDESATYGPIGVAFVLSVWAVAVTAVVVGGILGGAVIDERRRQGRRVELARDAW